MQRTKRCGWGGGRGKGSGVELQSSCAFCDMIGISPFHRESHGVGGCGVHRSDCLPSRRRVCFVFLLLFCCCAFLLAARNGTDLFPVPLDCPRSVSVTTLFKFNVNCPGVPRDAAPRRATLRYETPRLATPRHVAPRFSELAGGLDSEQVLEFHL